MSEYTNKKNKKNQKNRQNYDFEEESRRRKDFKRRKRDIREQEYETKQNSEYNY